MAASITITMKEPCCSLRRDRYLAWRRAKRKMCSRPGGLLAFHPDLIRGMPLSGHMKDYSFFAYDVGRSLASLRTGTDSGTRMLRKIGEELAYPIDKHSKRLIATNIELLLNYCVRFYDRQFITRDHVHKDVLVRFEALLNDYLTLINPKAGVCLRWGIVPNNSICRLIISATWSRKKRACRLRTSSKRR